jgi:CMP-N-acetylneuraminic acid synthetase
MNIGLVIGKKTSTGTPGKNTRLILGRPSAEYAFIAAKYSKIDRVFVSTDCPVISEIGKSYGADVIDRPSHLATPDSLTEDVLTHAYTHIKQSIGKDETINSISLLFANNPAIHVERLNEAIDKLSADEDADSCFSVSKYDMFSPVRARKVENGEIKPFVDLSVMDNVSSIRDSSGSVYFCDLAIQVMKERCFVDMDNGQLPFKWQGKKSLAIENDFGFDIDSEWQFIVIEYWLKKHGFSHSKIPW